MPEAKSHSSGEALLAAALVEANTASRSYDTKAQIAAVGYIFSLGIAGQIQAQIGQDYSLTAIKIIVVWLVFMLPILQFGFVLYPTRSTMQGISSDNTSILFIEDPSTLTETSVAMSAKDCDPLRELSGELLRVSRLRQAKRRRFILGLAFTMIAYFTLFLSQLATV